MYTFLSIYPKEIKVNIFVCSDLTFFGEKWWSPHTEPASNDKKHPNWEESSIRVVISIH